MLNSHHHVKQIIYLHLVVTEWKTYFLWTLTKKKFSVWLTAALIKIKYCSFTFVLKCYINIKVPCFPCKLRKVWMFCRGNEHIWNIFYFVWISQQAITTEVGIIICRPHCRKMLVLCCLGGKFAFISIGNHSWWKWEGNIGKYPILVKSQFSALVNLR